jgi:hypothetical protein
MKAVRLVFIGIVIGLSVALAVFGLRARAQEKHTALVDRRADSLAAVLLSQARKLRADSLEQLQLSRRADSLSGLAKARLERPRVVYVVTSDTASAASGDTVQYALVRRSIDAAAFRIPQYILDEDEAKSAVFQAAWQAEQKARLFADSTTIPELRRHIAAAAELGQAKDDQLAARDRTIAAKSRKERLLEITLLAVTAAVVLK